MGLIAEQRGLFVTDPALEAKRRNTSPGMAHFAGSGPERRTCRECRLWTGCGQDGGYYSKKGVHAGALKPRACQQYRDLMQGDVGPGVPHHAMACKYFVENADAPPIFAKS